MREVFGDKPLIQRGALHKRRNIADRLPDIEKAWVDAKLVKAFNHPDPGTRLCNAKRLAGRLDTNYPSAAASLREGLEEMFTVTPLGIDGRLARTPTTSNPVESMISIARTTNRNVTRWRDRQMVLRWTAAQNVQLPCGLSTKPCRGAVSSPRFSSNPLITTHATRTSCTPQVIWSPPIRVPPAPRITFWPDAKGFPLSFAASSGGVPWSKRAP